MAGRGYNLRHGFDNGPPPPGAGYPYAPQGQFPQFAGWGGNQYQVPLAGPASIPQQFPQWGVFPGMFPPGGYPGMNGAANPPPDGGFPGIHLKNHTGGVGLPPGYNYVFPQEHCKIHVFKTKEKPWQCQLWKEDISTHVKLFVPVTTTVKELMQNLGCTNPVAGKNVLYEICEKGNGRWASGIRITGNDKDKVKKEIKDFGWDQLRTGHPGERGVVWLWVTKDGA